jgi:uncharacterized protein (TIGR03067 family)
LGVSFSSGRFTIRQFVGAVVILTLAVPLARADEKDAKKLEGTYEVVSVMFGGKVDDEKKNEVEAFVIKDGVLTIKMKGGEKDETAKFTVDPSKKPAHIDIAPEKGKDKKVLGIYETKDTDKGMELTLVFTKTDTERPKDFKGEGKEDAVIKLFRKK